MKQTLIILPFALILCLSGCKSAATKSLIHEAGQGNAAAQYELGVLYENGRGVIKNPAVAAKWYRKAAEQGHAEAQYNLGRMYEKGWWWVDSFRDYFEKTGSRQTSAGSHQIADHVEAAKWYRMAAEQGHAEAQYHLGVMYLEGSGVPNDGAETVRWYRKAADQGNADAKNEIERYPYNKFEKILNSAAQGDAEAQYELGCIYANGLGTPPRNIPTNIIEALKWFHLAVEQGYKIAEQNSDFLNRFEDALQKAQKGDAEAQYELGRIYETGARMINSDISTAKKWYRLAREQGYEDAVSALSRIYRDEELMERRRRHEWHKKHDANYRRH